MPACFLNKSKCFVLLILLIFSLQFIVTLQTTWIAASLLLFYGFKQFAKLAQHKYILKIISTVLLSLYSALFALHWFNSPSFFILEQQVSANAPLVSIYYNFDKLILGLAILFCVAKPNQTANINKLQPIILMGVFLLACGLIFGLAVLLAQIKLEPKLLSLSFFSIWAFKNLILVCFGEELLFRGFIQNQLAKWHPTKAWLITSALFGLAHIPAGLAYACLAALSGLLYGWIYLQTQQIRWAIIAHFSFNLLHLLLFTYPYWQAQ